MSASSTPQRSSEAWGSLRRLPSKRWQARFTGPDGATYNVRTENGKALTFLTKGDACQWLSATHAAISRGEWEPPADAERRRLAEAAAAAARDTTFREYAEQWLIAVLGRYSAMMAGGMFNEHDVTTLGRRCIEAGLLPSSAELTPQTVHAILEGIGQRLRYAIGEYPEDPTEPAAPTPSGHAR